MAVPELARRYVAAEGPDAQAARRTIELTFATLHRLLGVGIGEHLGYLLTGLWTLLVAASIPSGTAGSASSACRSVSPCSSAPSSSLGPTKRTDGR